MPRWSSKWPTCWNAIIRQSASTAADYLFSGAFVDYAVRRHGYPALLNLVETYDFPRCFGKAEEEVWNDWVVFLNEYYRDQGS